MADTSTSIDLTLNGAPFTLDGPATVAGLIAVRQPRPPFAVEVNKRLVRRNEYDTTPLSPGDRVEVVSLVGGG